MNAQSMYSSLRPLKMAKRQCFLKCDQCPIPDGMDSHTLYIPGTRVPPVASWEAVVPLGSYELGNGLRLFK